MSLSSDIKEYALDIGFHAVGITTADPFPQYTEALAERRDEYVYNSSIGAGADPRNNLPEAKSIVVTVLDYFREAFPPALVGKIGRLYQSRSYLSPPTRIHGARQVLMRQFLEGSGCRVGTGPAVAERQAAVRAGAARFGRNTFVVSPGLGSFILMNSFVVDQELEYDQPVSGLHCPPDCRLCRDACPTGAIYDDIKMDPRRCIAFNTFSTRGDNGVSPYIPLNIRPHMGSWIHGCDLCQEACPKNQPKLKAKLPVNPFLEQKAAEFDLASLLNLSDEFFSRVVQPLMYNYIRNRNLFRRNAAIALGNQGDPSTVPALAGALEDADEVVRSHVAWALGRIGGRRARASLQAALMRETAEVAKREIEGALAGAS